MFRQSNRVRVILTIFLPFQVTQEVLPQKLARWRIFSPLTSNKRALYHGLPAEESLTIEHQLDDFAILSGQLEEVPTFAIK